MLSTTVLFETELSAMISNTATKIVLKSVSILILPRMNIVQHEVHCLISDEDENEARSAKTVQFPDVGSPENSKNQE